VKVVFTDEALQDLDQALEFIAINYPGISRAFGKRLRSVITRIGAWPKSAPEVKDRPGVHMVPLIRYPYKIFYRIQNDAVEILYIQQASRLEPWDEVEP
jgi:toxin ParE1/3/4